MGFLDSLFGTGGSASQEQARTTAQTNYPDWYNRLQQANLLRGAEAAFEEYQPYGGPRMAIAGPEQQAARAGFGGLAGIAAPSFAEAMRQSRLGATQLAGADITPYMSPFQQAVTDVALREARRQGDIQRRGLESQATKAGAFGGSRAALEQAEAERNIQRGLADIQATGSQAAYESALAQLAADRAAAATAAPQMAALGTGLQATLTSGLKEAELAGERERAERQGALDIAYQDYLTQRAYPMAQASGLQALLQGAQVPGSSLQTTFGQPPSAAGQIGGLGLSALGLLGSTGAFGPAGYLAALKDGGEVPYGLKYQDGSPGGVQFEELGTGANLYDQDALERYRQEALTRDAEREENDTGSSFFDWLNTQLETSYDDPENVISQVQDALSGIPAPLQRRLDIEAAKAAAQSGGPSSDPDAGMTPLLAAAMAGDPEDSVVDPDPVTSDPDTDTSDSGSGGFDYDLLLELGLGMMAAGAVPGSTLAGSLGQGGLAALQARREADALRRKEDLENRKLEAIIQANQQDYVSALATLSRDQLEDQLNIVEDDVKFIYDELEFIAEDPLAKGVSVTGRDKEELDVRLKELLLQQNTLRNMLGFSSSDDFIPADAAAD